jgi:formate dehydrogenase subunit beta
MKNTVLKVKNKDTLGGLRDFFGSLLESGFVDALLVPKMLSGGDGYVQALVKDKDMLEGVHPIAPTMAVQTARILTELNRGNLDKRVGVVLKPCELRAAVELVKFLQVNLENVVSIGVDCPGTYKVSDYAEMTHQGPGESSRKLSAGSNGDLFGCFKDGDVKTGEESGLRESCRICEYPVPVNADIELGFFGLDLSKEINVAVSDKLENEFTEKLSMDFDGGITENRNKVIQKVIDIRKKERGRVFADLKARTGNLEDLMQVLSTCIRCHNCMNVCPICYCRECVFESSVFEPRAGQTLNLAARKGAARMPGDTLIFHLTRMSHMGTSCVSCGMCDSACPNQLPVSSIFGLIGKGLQDMFEYVPGRDATEEPPVSVFKEDELQAEAEN